MNKYLKLIFAALILLPVHTVQAASLDELYRDIIRDDNEGYLPIFVKNRSQPDLLFEEDLEKLTSKKVEEPEPDEGPINLINERKIREAEALAKIKKWQETVKAVKENRVTPVDLEEINRRVLENDPKAVEILAWMNARGVGVKQNLITAFDLYRKAAALNVEDANKNAALVYRSMSRLQRESLTPYKD